MGKSLSLVMPTSDMGGSSRNYMEYQFHTAWNQTTDDFDIVVSDQTSDDWIEKRCEYYSDRLDIKYHRFNGPKRLPNNTNNALKLATGKILKPLFLDDIMLDETVVETYIAVHDQNPDSHWAFGSFGHFDNETPDQLGRFMSPKWNDQIYLYNTLGNPSVMSVKNDPDLPLMDETFIWVVDIEWYKRLQMKYGMPLGIERVLIGIRLHDDSMSSSITDEVKNEENERVRNMYEAVENDKV